jgi:hypothetical protein
LGAVRGTRRVNLRGSAVRSLSTTVALCGAIVGLASFAPSTQQNQLTKADAIARAGHPTFVAPHKAPQKAPKKRPKVPPKAAKLRASLDFAPTVNIAPQPNFVSDCAPTSVTAACVAEAVAAINNARSYEHLGPMTLRVAAFLALSPNQQLFVVTNLERVSRGLLPATAMTGQLDTAAAQGAAGNTDPSLKGWTLTGGRPAVEWSSNWAGDLNAFGADYYWMYADGVGVNVDCKAIGGSGCWEHRENVLMASPTAAMCQGSGAPVQLMGASFQAGGYQSTPSIAELYVGSCGALPSDVVFTWARAKQLLGIS